MLDELKIRYKQSKLSVRLAICALLALIPAALLYMDESSLVDEEYAKADTEQKEAADRLVQADETMKNLPKKEKELAFTREQLKKAEDRLPDNVVIDEVLRTIGKSAKTYGVNVALFEPQAEVVRGDSYKYTEVPLRVSVEGHDYGQICEWLDDVAGSKSKIYLKSWKLGRKAGSSRADPLAANSAEPVVGQVLTPSQIAERSGKKARENLRLVLDADISLFKLASAANISDASASAGQTPAGGPSQKAQQSVNADAPPVDPAAASALPDNPPKEGGP